MDLIKRLLANPAALVGVVRAVLIAGTLYGFAWFSDAHTSAVLELLGALLPILSLALTGISATATDAKIQEALNTPVPGAGGDQAPSV